VVENTVLPGCSSLSELTYSILVVVRKFITLRPFVVSGRVNNHWKAEKLLFVWPVYAPT
jgi:hypothetical protein